LKFVLCFLLALVAGFVFLAMRSGDPLYSGYEWLSPARFHQYDSLISSVAAGYQLDPMLVKAVAWRESRFDREKVGSAGERGLMQVTPRAATEWARERQPPRGSGSAGKVNNFNLDELFDPKTNLEAGSWYLRRALDHWQNQTDPLPFALAEYNAGPSRAQRWVGSDGVTPNEFLARIDFPLTRNYVQSILNRYAFYKKRGRM
jgi:soluble lytic murein transglycosylase